MKNKIFIFSAVVAISASFASCTAGSASKSDTIDSVTGQYKPTNPYRDTFATTSSYGNASTIDNSGSGGLNVAKSQNSQVPSKTFAAPAAPAAAKADTAAKK